MRAGGGDLSRLPVQDAERAQVAPVERSQRSADVEPQTELAGDQGIRERSGIGACILDDPGFVAENGRRAQTGVARDLGDIFQTVVRLEPDAVGVHDAHDRDRHVEQLRRSGGDPIEHPVRRGVEDVISPDGCHPGALVRGELDCRHRCSLSPPIPQRSLYVRHLGRKRQLGSAGTPIWWLRRAQVEKYPDACTSSN